MVYNKKLIVDSDEQNLNIQKKMIEELERKAWLVTLAYGYVDYDDLTFTDRVLCVSRKRYRRFIIDGFGNLLFCNEETYEQSQNEEITYEELMVVKR